MVFTGEGVGASEKALGRDGEEFGFVGRAVMVEQGFLASAGEAQAVVGMLAQGAALPLSCSISVSEQLSIKLYG